MYRFRPSRLLTPLTLLATLLPALPLPAAWNSGLGLEVLVGGTPRPEYSARGTTYVEAIRGREYTLRITNPYPYRVAVALSVDGLNTIDARRTDAANARKWVLDPYESTVISGWQVSDSSARRFYFTGEASSYGAQLGQTENLGVIEAVFFREKRPVVRPYQELREDRYEREAQPPPSYSGVGSASEVSPMGKPDSSEAGGARDQAAPRPAEPGASAQTDRSRAKKAAAPVDDELAATGMGGRTRHEVTRVDLELESTPAARLRLRYEFRPQLVKLGVLPRWGERPLDRRERSRGFSDGYCPEPGR